jgi:hypothetical protein
MREAIADTEAGEGEGLGEVRVTATLGRPENSRVASGTTDGSTYSR